jgi:hypothetical protein
VVAGVEGPLVGRRQVLLLGWLLLLLALLALAPWAPPALLAPASARVRPRALGLLTLGLTVIAVV